MELWQYYRILRKRKWLIIVGTLICAVVVLGLAKFRPDNYIAYTTVVEKLPDKGSINIFSGPTYQFDPRLRLANLMQLAQSGKVKELARSEMQKDGIVVTDETVAIMDSVRAEPAGDTMVLRLAVVSPNESEARRVVDYVRYAFIQRYNEMNNEGAERMRDFLQSELPRKKAEVDRLQEALKNYKEQSGAVMLQNQGPVLVQQMAQFESNLAQYKTERDGAQAKMRSLQAQLRDFPGTRQQAVTVQANPVWQELKVELAKQQIELQRMLKDRTPEHPDVQALEQQIKETEKKLAEAGTTIVGAQTDTVNPVRDSLVQSYVTSLAEFSSSDAACSAATQVIGSLKPELQSLPEKERRLAEMSIELESATSTYTLLKQKFDEATIKVEEGKSVSAIQVLDEAQSEDANPGKRSKMIIAILLAPILCSGIAFLLNYLDNSVKTPVEAEELLKMPVFASVPLARLHSLADQKALPAVGTSYQMLSANLWIKSAEMESRTILVASAEPNVGRSTTATNLAVTLARDGARVILVDGDLRQPSQHKAFGLGNEKGLSNILAGQMSIRDALKTTSVPDLLAITSGPLPVNPVRLLRSPEMQAFVAEVNDLAEFVVFDSPGGVTFADATLMAALIKNVVIVHAAGSVPRGAETEFRTRLEQVGARFVGAVLNMVKAEDSHGYYHFRSAYGELLRDGKQMPALPGSATRKDS